MEEKNHEGFETTFASGNKFALGYIYAIPFQAASSGYAFVAPQERPKPDSKNNREPTRIFWDDRKRENYDYGQERYSENLFPNLLPVNSEEFILD